jgi:hypothetical protein
MTHRHPFKWHHFEAEIILLCALVLMIFAQLPEPRT